MPPVSSKNRSNTMSSWVGSTPPSTARPAAQVVDDQRGGDGVDARHLRTMRDRGRRARRRRAVPPTALRSRDTSSDSSSVRAGASPTQNGIVGCLPVGVAHPHDAVVDLRDLPRVGAEQEDVAVPSTRSPSPR